MRLFGLPYQFLPSVDPRYAGISKNVGRKFAENIVIDAPVITIIPGKPRYTASKSVTDILMANTDENFFKDLKQKFTDAAADGDEVRYYDFQPDYTTYMTYVNILCRTAAGFLGITETIDGYSTQRYDWRNYKWTETRYLGSNAITRYNNWKSQGAAWQKYLSEIGYDETDLRENNATDSSPTSNSVLYETTSDVADSTATSVSVDDILANSGYVQFYIDTDASSGEQMTNQATQSKFEGMFQTGQDTIKELAFIINSGGANADDLSELAATGLDALNQNVLGGLTGKMSRILDLTGNVIRGENVIMPDIYQSSSYDKQYTITAHLKNPYGTRYGYFLNIVVPMMHFLALAIPKQATANTYNAPFLVKAFIDGVFNCNMGLVTSLSFTKCPQDSTVTVDGLPTEVDVSMTIADLYSDLSMSPQTSPTLFRQNSSLIDYLSVTCGLNLVSPNLSKKYNMVVNSYINSLEDIPGTISGKATDFINDIVSNVFLMH